MAACEAVDLTEQYGMKLHQVKYMSTITSDCLKYIHLHQADGINAIKSYRTHFIESVQFVKQSSNTVPFQSGFFW